MTRLGLPSLNVGLGIPDPMAGLGFGLGSDRQLAPRLDPEQEQSLLAWLGGGALGGINYVAETFSKPQAALFGLMAADPGQLANLIPFSDTLGLTNPAERYEFRDVLDTWGVSPPNVEGFHPFDNPTDALWDAIGFAGDLAIDPLLPLSVGGKALTVPGKLAKAAGLLDNLRMAKPLLGPTEARMTATLADLSRWGGSQADDALRLAADAQGVPDLAAVMNEPIGSLFNYAGVGFGSADNPVALKAAQGLDWAREAALFNPIMRPITSLMSAKAGQATSQVGQDLLMPSLFDARETSRGAARGRTAQAVSELELAGGDLAAPTEEAGDALRRIFEGVDVAPEEYERLAAFVKDEVNTMIRDARTWGLKTERLVDPEISYFPRYLSEKIPKRGSKTGETQIVSAFDPANLKRQDFLVGVKGGTDSIKRLAKDAEIAELIDAGGPKAERLEIITDMIRQKYPEFSGTYTPRRKLMGGEKELPTLDRPAEVANWLMGLSPEVRQSGVFGNHPLMDLAARLNSSKQAVGVAKSLVEAFARDEFLEAASKTSKSTGGVPLRTLLRSVDIDPKKALRQMAVLREQPLDKATLKMLGDRTVPADLANDITRYFETFRSPQAAKDVGGVFDSLTNLYRAGVTSPWPAFHSRNLISGAFNNWLIGGLSPKAYLEANSLLRGGDVDVTDIPAVKAELALRNLPADATHASRVLREILFAQDVAPRHSSIAAQDAADVLGGTLDDLTSQRVGETPFRFRDVLTKYIGRDANTTLVPWKAEVRGVGGATESTFGPLAGGDKAGSYIEGLNRVAPMIALMRQGVDPAEAARRVGQAQVQYASRYFTPTEQMIARMGMPFYKFSRQMLPFTVEQLIQEPGGRLAKTIEALDAVRGDLSAAPDYVRETTGISLGEQEDGTNRYITGLGLPFEDALSFVGGGPQQALLELMSRANPLVKFPAEWATGESFFQRGPEGGRALEDLDPTVGRTLSNLLGYSDPVQILGNRPASQAAEAVLANSPLARFFTSARTASDPRKGLLGRALNLGTGVRISDISPAAEDAVIRERIEQKLREMGATEFSRVYFNNEDQAQLDPLSALLVGQLEAAQNTLADRAKERKAAKQELPGAGSL